MVTIRLDGLGAFHGARLVLSDVSTPIFRGGEVVAVIGPNAAGKSTLFKAIMGFVRLAKGEILVLGRPAAAALRKNVVAYVPQAEEVDWDFPV
ncbi:MAG: ATP-binding cassette domain-containing protein, partial [Mesorhizobium sp.]